MVSFNFQKLNLDDAFLIGNFFVEDNRGWFIKNFVNNSFKNSGIDFNVSETFLSCSNRNVIRGMHFQTNNPQSKIVSVVQGRVFDVIVDLRKNSRTYKEHFGVELSKDNHKALYIPRGFAHGFLSLDDNSIMLYLCDGDYDKESDSGILYNDEDLNIDWPIKNISDAIVSDRDLNLMSFKEFESLNYFNK